MMDFHCHLDLYPNPTAAVAHAIESKAYVLSVTTTPSAWTGTSKLVEGRSRIRTALGLHPAVAHQRRSELSLFDKLLGEVRYVGEVGLDGSPELRNHQEAQHEAFGHILRSCAHAGGRIISIHSKRAASSVLDALRAEPDHGIAILHWFSGSPSELRRAVDQGCWFSVGPTMLRGQRGKMLAAHMPKDRVLTETDGPFAQIDGRPLLPGEVGEAVGGLSGAWGIGIKEVQAHLAHNIARLVKEH